MQDVIARRLMKICTLDMDQAGLFILPPVQYKQNLLRRLNSRPYLGIKELGEGLGRYSG